MQHIQFQGTHYDMGYRYGAALARAGTSLLAQAPYPITGQRRDFARACLPIYRAHFPALLEEIRGLARGQGCGEEDLHSLLFSMYALPPACGCSCFTRAGDGADVAFARDLLAGRLGFLCQYDRAAGQDTVWSVLYDLGEKTIFRAEGNPGRTPFLEDRRFAFS